MKHPKSQFETKPWNWNTTGIAYSTKIKNKLCKSFCEEKDPHKKGNYERKFKTYRNLLSTLPRETRKSITNYTLVTTKKTWN